MKLKGIYKGCFRGNERILSVLCAAMVLRLAYMLQLKNTPVGNKLFIDSAFYHEAALRLIKAGWMGDQVFFMNPFYSYFLALVYTCLGVDWIGIWFIQSAMGTMVCYFTYALGTRVWNKEVGLVAAGSLSLYGILIFYDGALLTASPILFLNTWALFLLFSREKPHWIFLIGAGILLGLSATARPFSLLFALVMVPIFFRENRTQFLKKSLLLWAGIIFVIMPVIMRNYAIGGEWGLTTSSAGMNFYVGNHSGATGIYAQVDFLSSAEPERERIEFIEEAQRRCRCELTPAEASRYWLKQGLLFIVKSPAAYAHLIVRKTYLFLNGVESQNNLSFYFAQDFSPILSWAFIGWWFICPLGIAGWFISSRESKYSPLAIYCLCYWSACMLFFVSSEYRLPVVPVLALYGAYFMVSFWNAARDRRLRFWIRPCIVLALISIPVLYKDAFAQRLTMRRVDYYNFAALYEREGERGQAASLYRKALEIDPYFQPARLGLKRVENEDFSSGSEALKMAHSALSMREYAKAIHYFEEAVASGYKTPEALNNMGFSMYKAGKLRAAEEALAEALKLRRTYDKASFNMALVKKALGMSDSAFVYMDRALQLNPAYRQALYKRGEWAVEEGDFKRGIESWQTLLSLVGEDERLRAKIDSLYEVMQ